MKNLIFFALIVLTLASCRTRVEPNHYGVLMENFGKNGKSDYSLQSGRVNDWGRAKKLFQVPAWEQRAGFEKAMTLEAADKTAFTSVTSYSYLIKKDRAVDVVFNNAQLAGENFMSALENNVLETRIYDIVKDMSRKYSTDTLMATGGNLRFENEVRVLVAKAFDEIGVELKTFTCPLVPTDKVAQRIDTRNEVNTNLSVLDQQIAEQRKKNELAELQRDYNKILSEGITPQLLQQQFIDKWDGKTPIYGNMPVTLFKQTP
jgi:hypothetical protein